MLVSLVGPPGCGKDTQARMLGQRFEFPCLTASECLEDRAKSGDDIARQIRLHKDRNQLVPDTIVHDVMIARLRAVRKNECVFLNGFPRTIDQYTMLVNINRQLGLGKILVCSILLHDDIALERMLGRKRPGEEAPQRCRIRLRDFRRFTEPMIKQMKDDRRSGLNIEVIEIQGLPERHDVFKNICHVASVFIPALNLNPEREAEIYTAAD